MRLAAVLEDEGAVTVAAPIAIHRASITQLLLASAFAALAAGSLVGLPLAVAGIPDGAARLELLGWTGVIALLATVVAASLRLVQTLAPVAGRAATVAQPVLVLALLVVAVLVQVLAFQSMPQFPDSFAELFQARILAAGRLWLPAPARPDLVGIANVVHAGGRWYSQYPVGNPALLALGIVSGATWLPAALIALGLALGVRALARECAGEGAAALALFLALASPMVVLSAAAGMSQASVAALSAWTLALALRVRRHALGAPEAAAAQLRPARRATGMAAALGSGLLAGVAATVRPLDAAVLALVALAILVTLRARRRQHALAFLLGGGLGVLPLLLVNARTTGNAFLLGYEVLWGSGTLPGFGLRGWGVPFGPADGLRHAVVDLGGLNLALLEWPALVLVVLAGMLALRRRLPPAQQALAGYALAHIAAYVAYWHHDFFYGPRFLVPIVPALLVLLADGLVRLARRPLAGKAWGTRVLAFGREFLFVQLVVAAILVAWPRLVRAGQEDIAASGAIRDAARVTGRPRAILLVDDGWGARLFAQMWRLGVSAPAAERFYAAADACRLERAVRRVELEGRRGAQAEVALGELLAGARPGVPAGHLPAPRLRLPPAPLPTLCVEELAYDRERQRAPFAPLLWLNDVDQRGVLFWRDPGPARLAWLLNGADRPVFRVRLGRRAGGAFVVSLEPLHNAGPLRLK